MHWKASWLDSEMFVMCKVISFVILSIVNGGKWLGRPVNIKEANKQAKIGRSLTLHIFVLCSFHWLCMNYIITILVLVSCIGAHNHLLHFARFCAGLTPKIANKNIQQRTLPNLLTSFPRSLEMFMVIEDQWNICMYVYWRNLTPDNSLRGSKCIQSETRYWAK